MIDPKAFADRQPELTAEFGKYVFDHPEVDDLLAQGAHVYFLVEGETEFNQYSREMAERRQQRPRRFQKRMNKVGTLEVETGGQSKDRRPGVWGAGLDLPVLFLASCVPVFLIPSWLRLCRARSLWVLRG